MVGICGAGFVGRSVHFSLTSKDKEDVIFYDPNILEYSFRDNLKECNIIFICTPTPTIKAQQKVDSILDNLAFLSNINYSGLIVIKSTVLPCNIKKIIRDHDNLNIMYVPEFLDEHNPYAGTNCHILGTNNIKNVEKYFSVIKGPYVYVLVSPETASIIKYTHNSFAAVKVSYFNEIYDLCKRENVNYRTVIRGLLGINNNVGEQYTKISLDGERGFGGTCLPKDAACLASKYNIETLIAALNKNLHYRPEEMEKVLK